MALGAQAITRMTVSQPSIQPLSNLYKTTSYVRQVFGVASEPTHNFPTSPFLNLTFNLHNLHKVTRYVGQVFDDDSKPSNQLPTSPVHNPTLNPVFNPHKRTSYVR